jgi:hypothetical protein
MTSHAVGTRETWLKARLALLEAEKELTRRSDAVTSQRQALPWVPVEKAYRFDTEEGACSLRDFFAGRSQLLIYHFMFGPDYVAGCPSCSAIADGFNGVAVHLVNHDVSLVAEHVRSRRRRGLPRVLDVCAWSGRDLGVCISGLIAHPRVATRRGCGGSAMTNTASRVRDRVAGRALPPDARTNCLSPRRQALANRTSLAD